MRHFVLPAIAGFAIALLLAFAAPTYAASTQFKADLKGSSEVPPNQSAATGSVTATYDSSDQDVDLEWQLFGAYRPGNRRPFPRSGRTGQERRRRRRDQAVRKPVQGLGDADRGPGGRPYGWPLVRQRPHCGQPGRRDTRPTCEVIARLVASLPAAIARSAGPAYHGPAGFVCAGQRAGLPRGRLMAVQQ